VNRRPEIGLGDLLRALQNLRPDNEAELQAIRDLLGAPSTPAIFPTAALTVQADVPALARAGSDVSAPEPLTPTPVPEPMDFAPPPPPLPASGDPDLPFDVRPLSSAIDAASASLFNPWWQRAIVSTALATREPDGELDVGALVEAIVSSRPPVRLPQRMVSTLRRGAQVLIDVSGDSLPFLDDLAQMERVVRDVVGGEAARVLRFAVSPIRGTGPRGRSTWRPYQPPLGGCPVLVLSTFSLYGEEAMGPPVKEWLAFAEQVRAVGSSVVAFVPSPPRTWPMVLSRTLRLVLWDRGTTVRDVRGELTRRH